MKLNRNHLPHLAAAFLGIALYAVNLAGTYIYDDVYIAQLDPRLHHVHRWSEFFTRAYFPGAPDRLFRPLTSFTFAFEMALHGQRPWISHLINLLLYAGLCSLVAELARRISGLRAAWIAGLLFALHPVHVEVVSYLVGRADLLCDIGIVSALVLFLANQPLTIKRAFAIWALMLFAIFSKEPGMLLPFILLAWLPFRRRQLAIPKSAEKSGAQTLLLLLCWTLAGYIVFREESRVFKFSWDPHFMDWTINPLGVAAPADRWLLPFALVGRYLQLLLFPWHLNIDYSGWISPTLSLANPYFYLGIAAVIAWWAALIIALRRRAYAYVGALLCFVLSYSMVSNFGIVIGALFGERLIFLPSLFFILLLALLLRHLIPRTLTTLLIPLCLLAVLRTETYAYQWNNALRLYTYCSNQEPASARLRMLIMDRLTDQGDYEAAIRQGLLGCAAQPEYWRIWHYTAQVEAQAHHYAEAQKLIDHGLSLKHTDPGSFGGLRTQIQSGEFDKPPSQPTDSD